MLLNYPYPPLPQVTKKEAMAAPIPVASRQIRRTADGPRPSLDKALPCSLYFKSFHRTSFLLQVTKEKKQWQRQSQLLLDKFGEQLTVVDLKEITEEDVTSSEGDGAEGDLSKQLQERVEGKGYKCFVYESKQLIEKGSAPQLRSTLNSLHRLIELTDDDLLKQFYLTDFGLIHYDF